MKIAIAKNKSDLVTQWIQYCINHGLAYILVDVYDTRIIDNLRDCDVFLWHHHHGDYRDVNFAKQLLNSIDAIGLTVYPDYNTGWHFDDKVGEKYLFEALGLPAVSSFVFYDKRTAIEWARFTTYPKVFKLRGGAGSSNVRLVQSYSQAKHLIKKSFSSGFPTFSRISYFKERLSQWKSGKENFLAVIKGLYRLIKLPEGTSLLPNQKGYAYFQDFMPNNDYDTRVVVIGGKYAFAEKRYVREGDFRASGSGSFDYDNIDTDIIRLAFDAAKSIKAQSIAFDFIYDENRRPLIVEMSYAFGTHGISKAPYFWKDDMSCHKNNIESIGGLILKQLIECK